MPLQMTATDLTAFLHTQFDQVAGDFSIDDLSETALTLRLLVTDRHLRPGGTVSGPSIFALADVALYLAILSQIGPVALTVTTSAHLDFMRKPQAGRDLLAQTQILKLGRSLVVGDVMIRSEGSPALVARASLTYSIPPR